jgi:hypothetical protein
VNALNIDLVISGRPGTHHRQRRWLQSCSSAPAPWTLPCQALAV